MAVREEANQRQTDVLKKFPELLEQAKLENMLQLAALAWHKNGKQTHVDVSIKLQRLFLKDYFDDHGFPTKANNISTQRSWLKKNETPIIELLGLVKCGCNYSESLDALWTKKGTGTAPQT
ncbi:MAG: hypothetical protein GWN86_24120, partial [Desulfobacterales bacterium]|nr:hypothetical protein [Desulfobacterales bacterium]